MNSAQTFSKVTSTAYCLFHAPFFTKEYGTLPESERKKNPESVYCAALDSHIRTFDQVVSYPPNQAFIGNIDPRELPERPWYDRGEKQENRGPFGKILDEMSLYGLIKIADVFDLVLLEEDFSKAVFSLFKEDAAFVAVNLEKLQKGVSVEEIRKEIQNGALPLEHDGLLTGCIKPAHPTDVNLSAHTILENLSAKATAVYTVCSLVSKNGVKPESIDYIIETSEEACGDVNQRGGGNFAKSIGELAGFVNATGSDVRSFCAGPVHGLLQAAALVSSGTFSRVVVAAGGTTAKLGMNSKKHIEKGLPVLEDCMGGFAVLVEKNTENTDEGLVIRTDTVGKHKIGSGASPQAVVGDLVAEPLYSMGYSIRDIDFYAPELQNPEITENAGAGNVTLANLKMIAAMAVMKKEMERGDIDGFITEHGFPGWAPTQGHIPSGIPAIGWFLKWAEKRESLKAMIIGKGSLFLGRMTNLFDGVSLLLEKQSAGQPGESFSVMEDGIKKTAPEPVFSDSETTQYVIGLTIPGSECGSSELHAGAEQAMRMSPFLKVRFFGNENSSPEKAHREMEAALQRGEVNGAVTFHYPFPIGISTIGLVKAAGTGKDLFLATTTGTVSTGRVEALVQNAVLGTAAAKAWGIPEPVLGFLNLEGAAAAEKRVKELIKGGWRATLGHSVRGETLLRGNDLLGGTCDVVVCDSLTGNAVMKLLSAYSSGGKLEISGSGYGPGLGLNADKLVHIISRASSASVVANALFYALRMAEGGIFTKLKEEFQAAQESGLKEILGNINPATPGSSTAGNLPGKKPVDCEIEGIDVLEVDKAVGDLLKNGIYAEAGMGCTGPVIMLAREDRDRAHTLLKAQHYL